MTPAARLQEPGGPDADRGGVARSSEPARRAARRARAIAASTSPYSVGVAMRCARDLAPVVSQQEPFDLGAANVDADPHGAKMAPAAQALQCASDAACASRAVEARIRAYCVPFASLLAALVVLAAGLVLRRRAGARRRARAVLHDAAVCLPAGLLSAGRELGLRAVGRAAWTSARRSPSGCRIRPGAFVDTLMVTNATVGARDRQPPRPLGLPVGPAVSLRQADHVAADLGARARQDLRDAHHAGGDLRRRRPDRARAASAGTSRTRRPSSTTAARCSRARRRRPSAPRSTRSPARAQFNSEKGKFDPTTPSYYPPRSDLTSFASNDGSDPPTFAAINDLDAVAAATPAYGAVYNGTWSVPRDAAARRLRADGRGEQGVRHQRLAHCTRTSTTANLPGYGTERNFGQPSVVYQVPIHIDVTTADDGRAGGLADRRLRRLDGRDRRRQSARRHHLDRRPGLGRGAAARDQRQRRAERPGARQRRALRSGLRSARCPRPRAAVTDLDRARPRRLYGATSRHPAVHERAVERRAGLEVRHSLPAGADA